MRAPGFLGLQMLWTFGRVGFQDDVLMDVMHAVAEKLAAGCDRCMRLSSWGCARARTCLVMGMCPAVGRERAVEA